VALVRRAQPGGLRPSSRSETCHERTRDRADRRVRIAAGAVSEYVLLPREAEESSDKNSTSGTTTARDASYRARNLRPNHITVRGRRTPLPDGVLANVSAILAARGPPLEQTSREMDRLSDLALGCSAGHVEAFLMDTAFPGPRSGLPYRAGTDGLAESIRELVSLWLVPFNPTTPFRVSQPRPDRFYGYSSARYAAFTPPQALALDTLHPDIPHYARATRWGNCLPFLSVEFRAAGDPGRGDLWDAANHCAGASATCLAAVAKLNTALDGHPGAERVDGMCYSVAADQNIAQLFVSWKDGPEYYVQQVADFLLSRPEYLAAFRATVCNILNWGMGARLKQVRRALDLIAADNLWAAQHALDVFVADTTAAQNALDVFEADARAAQRALDISEADNAEAAEHA